MNEPRSSSDWLRALIGAGNQIRRNLTWLSDYLQLQGEELPRKFATGRVVPVVDVARAAWTNNDQTQFRTVTIAGGTALQLQGVEPGADGVGFLIWGACIDRSAGGAAVANVQIVLVRPGLELDAVIAGAPTGDFIRRCTVAVPVGGSNIAWDEWNNGGVIEVPAGWGFAILWATEPVDSMTANFVYTPIGNVPYQG